MSVTAATHSVKGTWYSLLLCWICSPF